MVDLPDPVRPTRATVRPAGTVNETSCRTSASPYEKWTWSKRSDAGPRRSSCRVPYDISPVAVSTRCSRSHPATLRGSSASTHPIARIGMAMTVNR